MLKPVYEFQRRMDAGKKRLKGLHIHYFKWPGTVELSSVLHGKYTNKNPLILFGYSQPSNFHGHSLLQGIKLLGFVVGKAHAK